MKECKRKEWFKYNAPMIVCVVMIVILLLLPTGYEGALQYQEADRCVAKIIETDNSAIIDTGLVRTGEQRCKIRLLSGEYEGKKLPELICFKVPWKRISSLKQEIRHW